MKLCAYCGRDNVDEATNCRECGTSEFRDVEAPRTDWTTRLTMATAGFHGRQALGVLANFWVFCFGLCTFGSSATEGFVRAGLFGGSGGAIGTVALWRVLRRARGWVFLLGLGLFALPVAFLALLFAAGIQGAIEQATR